MQDITAKELKTKLDNKENFTLIDVREIHENAEFNIGGALWPLGLFPDKIKSLEGKENDEIVVYCRSGNRSGIAKSQLVNAGFKNVRNLLGGMMNWQSEIK
jgi:rhodanese-related sulfurtransferase